MVSDRQRRPTDVRYFIGEDIGNFVKAKREMPDEDLNASMCGIFLSSDLPRKSP